MAHRALFSLSNPCIGRSLGKFLCQNGWEIVATDETASDFISQGIPVRSIYDYLRLETRYDIPPTLHPKIELALTTSEPNERIDLLFDETYSFEKGIDIGGHTLIALAVKGKRYVVTDEQDAILFSRSPNPEELRTKLLQKASVKLQHFYNCCFEIQHTKKGLANGENPYQAPAYLHITDDSVALGMASLNPLSEQIPCYTNLADLDCLLNLVIALAKSFVHHFGKAPHLAVAAKHGNACGCAISWNSPMDALEHALWGNAKGIWGGELVVNFEITPEIAQAMLRSSQREARYGNAAWMLDIVAAPAFTEKAGPMLTARKFRKVFSLPELAAPDKAHLLPAVRCVRGGQLEQPPHDFILQIPPNLGWNDTIKTDMILAWAISFWSFHGGNEVAIVKDSMLLGAAGGPSTVDSANTAIDRARNSHCDSINGATFAANAFFPYTDAPKALVDAGCSYGVVPEGGQNFADVKKFFLENHTNVFFLPPVIRGFNRH